jgi:GNAT superfamily N-acetyltransferase
MASLEIHPLSGLRDEAAQLLSGRFARQRAAEPLLPEIDDFAAHVPAGDGVVATRGGKAVAYLAGELKDDIATVGLGGHAASEPEALRDLFAVLAERWGASRFSVAVPASDDGLIDAWFRLGFGRQFVWAVREVERCEPVDFGGRLRTSTPADLPSVAGFDRELWTHQAASPSFSGLDVAAKDFEDEWSTLWKEEDEFPLHQVAELDGRVVGQVLLYHRPTGDLRVPEQNIDLAHVVTHPDARGSGVGLALYASGMTWAHEHGYRSMTTDWRSVNLLSSRFWPNRGFRPQYFRLYRAVP